MTEAILHEAMWRIAMAVVPIFWSIAICPPGRLRNVCVAINVTIPALFWLWAWAPR